MRECTSKHPRWSVHCGRATELCTEPALLAWTWGSKHRRAVAWFGSEHLGLLQILLFKSRLRELRFLPPTNIHPRLRDLKYLPAPSKKGLQGNFKVRSQLEVSLMPLAPALFETNHPLWVPVIQLPQQYKNNSGKFTLTKIQKYEGENSK